MKKIWGQADCFNKKLDQSLSFYMNHPGDGLQMYVDDTIQQENGRWPTLTSRFEDSHSGCCSYALHWKKCEITYVKYMFQSNQHYKQLNKNPRNQKSAD